MKKILFLLLTAISIGATAQQVVSTTVKFNNNVTFNDSTFGNPSKVPVTTFEDTLRYTRGAGAGKILASDANGNAYWTNVVLVDTFTGTPVFPSGIKTDTIFTTGGTTTGQVLILQNDTTGVFANAPFWNLTGNASTTPGTNFIGTTDAKNFWLGTNGIPRAYLANSGKMVKVFGDSTVQKIGLQRSYIGTANDQGGLLLGPTLRYYMDTTGGMGTAVVRAGDNITDWGDSLCIDLLAQHPDYGAVWDATLGMARVRMLFVSGANNLTAVVADTSRWFVANGMTNDTVFQIYTETGLAGIQYKNGTQGSGKVLTSDANGNAYWTNVVIVDTFSGTPVFPSGIITDTVFTTGGTTGQVLILQNDTTGVFANAPFWNLTGNASTTPGTNFIGTTDAKDFITKTNGTIRQQISAGGSYYVTADTNYNWTAQRYLGTAGNAKIYAGSNVLGYGVDGFSLGYKNLGALAVGGNLAAFGYGDSAIFLRAKRVEIKSDSVITITGNGIISGSENSINKANSFTANAIVASSNCHLDSGANMSIIASHQSAVRGLSSNPGNNPAHTVILGGFADTVYSYHQIAFGPQAVTKRITYADASGWDSRDLLFSFGNSPRSDSANVAFEQSAIIMNKKGHIAFGEALDSTQIPDTTGALAKFYGSIAITDGSENTGKVLTSDAYGNATWGGSDGDFVIDSVATTGDTTDLAANTYTAIIASGAIIDLVLRFPASPANGDVVVAKFDFAVTTLTSDGQGKTVFGFPSSTALGQHREWRYNATTGAWY